MITDKLIAKLNEALEQVEKAYADAEERERAWQRVRIEQVRLEGEQRIAIIRACEILSQHIKEKDA